MNSISNTFRRQGTSYETLDDSNQQPSVHMLPISEGISRPRILDTKQHGKAIERFHSRWEKTQLYWGDLFHTLLNMPRGRFITIFFSIYVAEYFIFALFYLWQPDECIPNIHHLSAALWFSVQTAATIGYGSPLAPNPDCTLINVLVMFQAIFSSLVDYCMMGLMFARFSAPAKRSSSMRFSSSMTVYPHAASGYWCLALRVANMRKHLMIRPEVQILLARPENPGQSAFVCQTLQLEDPVSNLANLRLGLAVTLVHVIRPGSPLWESSVDDLLLQEMEIMVFFEGTDAMTSKSVQARVSYFATDMRMNERFATLYMMYKGNKLGLDFTEFNNTVPLGLADHAALMRRQKFCHLITAAQQQLEAEHRTAAQQHAGQSSHLSSPQQPVAANGLCTQDCKAERQVESPSMQQQQQDQHQQHQGHDRRELSSTRNGPLSPVSAASTAGVSSIQLASTSHEL